jgi:hypothetical protein
MCGILLLPCAVRSHNCCSIVLDLRDETGTEARFRAYPADLALVRGHADRVRPFEDYCVGLLSAQSRKSVEPLAAVTALERTAAQHQSLLRLVAKHPGLIRRFLCRVASTGAVIGVPPILPADRTLCLTLRTLRSPKSI